MNGEISSAVFKGFRDLKVWQRSRILVKSVYEITGQLPKEEVYGLTSQIRRCAVSIPSNIAEGSSKRSTREFIRFLNIAYGSLAELETQLLLASDLAYVTLDTVEPLFVEIDEIGRMTNGLISKLNEKLNSEL